MIVESGRDDDIQKIPLLTQNRQSESPEPSGSTFPPPPFTVVEATSVDETTLALGPPPEFAPYQAEYFEKANHDVVSHDPHLNSDGEALYRFLLSQSQTRPSYRIQCRGTHNELQSRWVTERDSQGNTRSRRETQTETIVDFDFCIDVHPEETDDLAPIFWTVYDNEPAYRGKMVQEYEDFSIKKHTQSKKERKQNKEWTKRRFLSGLPPWIRQQDDYSSADVMTSSPNDGLKSSKTVRQWADDYCSSPKYLKEFVYQKVLYGWNIEQLEIAIRSTIKSVPYNGSLSVDITPLGSKVYIRPDNKVSRMLSNMWLKFLSILLLIFPFIWLYKRFHPRGGGRWEVCGAAYPLKQWVFLAPGEVFPSDVTDALPPYDPVTAAGSRLATSPGNATHPLNRYMQTPTGPKKLVGTREGEWFRRWESSIRRAVIVRYQSQIPLLTTTRSLSEVELLDGYNEAAELIRY